MDPGSSLAARSCGSLARDDTRRLGQPPRRVAQHRLIGPAALLRILCAEPFDLRHQLAIARRVAGDEPSHRQRQTQPTWSHDPPLAPNNAIDDRLHSDFDRRDRTQWPPQMRSHEIERRMAVARLHEISRKPAEIGNADGSPLCLHRKPQAPAARTLPRSMQPQGNNLWSP
jgi:hypothetical protein